MRETPAVPTVRGHLPALDGLRGLAILAVMSMHFVPTGADPVEDVTRNGWMGVDLFFVLSGFLITGILADAKDRPGYFRNFYARRVLRIFPLYLFAVAVFLSADAVWPGSASTHGDAAPWLLTHTTNFKIAADGWTGTFNGSAIDVCGFWSLSIEEQFYFVWPFVIGLLPRRRAMAGCVGLIVGALGTRLALTAQGANPSALYVLTPCRVDALSVGSLIALALRTAGPDRVVLRWHAWAGAGAASVVAAALAFAIGASDVTVVHPFFGTVGYSLVAIAFGGLLVRALLAPDSSVLGRVLRSRLLVTAGAYSYGLYVWHGFLLRWYEHALPFSDFAAEMPRRVVAHVVWAIPPLTVACVLAWASMRFLEAPFLRLKRHFEPAPAPDPRQLVPAPVDASS